MPEVLLFLILFKEKEKKIDIKVTDSFEILLRKIKQYY